MKIDEKRTALEGFIREQITGPGINGYRVCDLEDTDLVSKDLLQLAPIAYLNEIIDIMPAAVYSSGILFPEDRTGTCADGAVLDNNELLEQDAEEDNDTQDDSLDDIDANDGIELNQMYPRMMGFTSCLNGQMIKERPIAINVEARYYSKLNRDRDGKFNDRYAIHCEVDRVRLSDFILQNNLVDFSVKEIGPNSFLILRRLSAEQMQMLGQQIRNEKKRIAENLYDLTAAFIRMNQLTRQQSHLSNLKSTIYYELKANVMDTDSRKSLYDITQEIELIENITEHLGSLLSINSGGYGLWQSQLIKRTILIDNLQLEHGQRKISLLYSRKDQSGNIKILNQIAEVTGDVLKNIFFHSLNDDHDDFASLSVNIQVSKDSRKDDDKVFLKVQLINTSRPFDQNEQDDSRYYSTFNELVNEKCFFGVKMSVTDDRIIPYNEFEISMIDKQPFDEDTTTDFIYRQYKDYGIGHGCSVKWDPEIRKVETEYIPACETPDIDPVPRDKCGIAVSNGKGYIDPLFLNTFRGQEFKWLSTLSLASDAEVISDLNTFVDAYHKWITNKRDQYAPGDAHGPIAKQELDKCLNDYHRMKGNIEKLLDGKSNSNNIHLFRLMNTAMFMQLWHSVKAKGNSLINLYTEISFSKFDHDFYANHASDRLFDDGNPAAWRAFQLAFIILNLDGIFQSPDDREWKRRNELVDLVWFPTGGGKTEAYLGLICLTILNRRAKCGKEGGGTAAIMRYTLRLLTMQQFQRATLVIMALEIIRRWKLIDLGEEPIYIGFWIGKNSIPNKLTHSPTDHKKESLQAEYEKLRDGITNKVPFSRCPWCNSTLRPQTTKVHDESDVYNYNRLHLFCDNERCSFSEPDFFEGDDQKGPIPVNLCDESIYQHPPALLFGTVDKFAQLAHKVDGNPLGRNKDSRRLFGNAMCNWERGRSVRGYLPPDLIIQDELHLLLGPLGSAVALFESAIDQLCTRQDGTRAKIISSTATTRNTGLQIAALFDRKVSLFPKPGVECDDSFFAFYRRKYTDAGRSGVQYLSKRKYLGILPTGRTQIWMQMRLAAIIMTHRAVFELQNLQGSSPLNFKDYKTFEKAMDHYHTVISYFNSLREVGKTQSQVQSYILKELRRVFVRAIRPQKLLHPLYTYGPLVESELTGRLSGEEVKDELGKVQGQWDAEKRFAHMDGPNQKWGEVPPEFVVATNMISVGIDVSRFNVILMNSMPRNIAEYIQASSRVARQSPGLVITIHHPFRARDVSHYEKFIEFHEKMYSYVEPISITPFTKKAVQRYMGLYLATMIRHTTEFVPRDSAGNISRMNAGQLLAMADGFAEYFVNRQSRMEGFGTLLSNLLKNGDVTYIKKWLNDALDEWKMESDRTINDQKDFVFTNKSDKAVPAQEQLYVDIEEYEGNIHSQKWQVPMSLRVIEPEAAIKINLK